MDTATIEKRGSSSLKPLLDRVAAVKTKEDIVRLWGSSGFAAPFYFSADVHPDRPDEMALWIGQSGLGMPRPRLLPRHRRARGADAHQLPRLCHRHDEADPPP